MTLGIACSAPIDVKRAIIGLLVSAIAIYFALRNVSLEEIALDRFPIQWRFVCLSVVGVVSSVVLRGYRLKRLLPSDDPVSRRLLSGATAILYMINNLVPARAGEVVRVVMINRAGTSNVSTVVTAIVVERMFDGITLSAMLLGTIFLADVDPGLERWFQGVGAALGTGLLVLLVLEWVHRRDPARAERWIAGLTGWLPAPIGRFAEGQLSGILEGLNLVGAPKRGLEVAGLSVAIWVVTAGAFWTLALGYPAGEMGGGWLMGPFSTGAVAIASSVPAAPGFLGVFQVTVKEAMVTIGSQPAAAFHYANLLWIVNWLTNNVLGLYYMLVLGIGVKELRSAGRVDTGSRHS